MKTETIYTLPKNYIERQRIIKALHDPLYELVMWYYNKSGEVDDEKAYLWGVYLNTDNSLCFYYYDIETLQRLGRGYVPGPTPGEKIEPGINELYRWLHKEGNTTDLLGYVIGVQSRPPKREGKIIQFPAAGAQEAQTALCATQILSIRHGNKGNQGSASPATHSKARGKNV